MTTQFSSEPAFDYIVVGGGSAGCVLANRLSERDDVRVLLLEAGGQARNPWLHVPLGFGRLFADARYNWIYATEAEAELRGRSASIVAGKVLGGSSAVNGMVFVRGQSEDFDQWSWLGNAGWSYAEVLPYFRRMEDWQGPHDPHRGYGGPQKVGLPMREHPLCEAFIAAAQQAGLSRNSDYNAHEQDGAAYLQTTTHRGRRWSTATAYLGPARRRPNLVVATGAAARRLRFDGTRVTGVEWIESGRQCTAVARREVILSAGAIASPQLLQVSGIGPAAVLQRLGIPVVAERPGVGRNLQDHYVARVSFRCTQPLTLNEKVATWFGRVRLAAEYALFRSGPMAVGAGCAGAFVRSDATVGTPDIYTLLLLFSAPPGSTALHPFPGMTFSTCQLRPQSRGCVEIRSPDAADPPTVRFNYLSTELDRITILRGIGKLREIVFQPAFRPLVAESLGVDLEHATDAELMEYIRATGSSAMHASCTCRMGADELAVVDSRLRVHGVQGLRVADASVMPAVVSGNTNAATIMIAEKCADMINSDDGKR